MRLIARFWIALATVLALAIAAPALAQKRIALSFDDVPRAAGAWLTPDRRTAMLIAALDRADVKQAAFFVTPGNLAAPDGARGAQHIAAYAAAGHVIANHSYRHAHLTGVSADAYLADIDRAAAWLADRPGFRPWFRFPFLDEGGADKAKRDAVRAGLKARGLANGYVTAEASDWNIEHNVVEAVAAGEAVDRDALRDLYVESHVAAANFADALMLKAIGRSPAHVMLLHETDIAALYVADLVAALRGDGWTIVTADEAYADPIARAMPDAPSAQGTLTEALAWEKGLPAPRWYEGNTPRIADAWFRTRVLKQAR